MPVKGSYEVTSLRQLQRYHHSTLNTFSDGETLVEAIHKRPGIYGPNPIAYLSLLARRPTLTLGDMEEALINDRSLVRATAFRGSLFLLASEDYPLYFRALFDTLRERHGFRQTINHVRLAVNDRFRDWDTPLADGDQVVFIPPVSGG